MKNRYRALAIVLSTRWLWLADFRFHRAASANEGTEAAGSASCNSGNCPAGFCDAGGCETGVEDNACGTGRQSVRQLHNIGEAQRFPAAMRRLR